uniref:Uncharacterized protein n=1 Tax=Romanomermis culicivorax TaxID=13658 RepID=A0A915HSX9_ROMCU
MIICRREAFTKAVGILSRNGRKEVRPAHFFCGFRKLRPASRPQPEKNFAGGNPQPLCGLGARNEMAVKVNVLDGRLW